MKQDYSKPEKKKWMSCLWLNKIHFDIQLIRKASILMGVGGYEARNHYDEWAHVTVTFEIIM